MRSPAVALAILLAPLSSWALGEPDGPARRSLDTLADTQPGAFGSVYENSQARTEAPGGAPGAAGRSRVPRLTAANAPTRRAAPDVAAPKPAEEKESGGLWGFIKKNKWNIGGGLAGGLVGLALGGGIFGILAGLAVSIAVAWLGPKIF
ncbi:MAG: hypothetical protein HY553_09590 [Elusimicrobia bacterium]|nr:hypothetical protein [Elusimicrobiota bacterium]